MTSNSKTQLILARILCVPSVVTRYIKAQRNKFLFQANPLTPAQRNVMSAFFSRDLLDLARLVVLDGIRLKNPPFHGILKTLGFSNLRDLSQVSAITFDYVIVSHINFTNDLLFHELVHVEQYRQLGIRRFSELYVRGFLAGGGYDGIPLESNAFELGCRFEANHQDHFSVAEVVAQWIQQGKY